MSQEAFPQTKPVSVVAQVSQPVRPGQPTMPVQPASATNGNRDALAGALPGWDLLPATPFIRRVK